MNTAPPNWYPDPQDGRLLRYWDGNEWTGDRQAISAVDAVQGTQPGGGQAAKVPLLGARAYAKRQSQELVDALAENQRLRAQLASIGGLEATELQRLRDQLAAQVTEQQALLGNLRAQVINTREEQVLQEIGIYEYRHPLSDAVAYREALKQLQGEIKYEARRDGGAIEASTTWTVNGSVTEGRRMIREYSMLMLRAYNAEADNLVRSLKPYKLPSALERLDKIAITIERLGKTMQLRVAPYYHELRRRELAMTADHLEMVARQKQYERDERDRLREERKAYEELTRERAKLEQQQQQYRDALTALEATNKKDTADADDLRARLEALEYALADIAKREDNISAGYVYVISNIGAFGENVVQIGLTRRYHPWDRISDLSNAAVPFRYDVHAMHYDDNAAGIEAELHRRLADKRINHVNQRREFFRATPAEVRDHLQALAGRLLEFNELAEAVEYRQSLAAVRDMNPE
ncbi:DUF4041 domain-containing protein [Nocardia sp. NPDC020380]|uniref:DUF4041 domain-containing protein n=1 Tax=Nocardia sp. NPDC020380 TaxID=3364309 RepID=UPI00378D1E45